MPTELVTIYYNGHFTQMVYPENLSKQLADYGLPAEDIKTVKYDSSKLLTPFSIGENSELILLKEEVSPVTPKGFNDILIEILNTPVGKSFIEAIKLNNETLMTNGLQTIQLDPTPEDYALPEVTYYSIVETVQSEVVL